MISVAEALDALFALVRPLDVEDVPLTAAAGRMLARDVVAARDQPPFAASAMDGYAVADDAVRPGATFTVVGEAAAGHAYTGQIGVGQAARIFTGAPLPAGTDRVVIQEDVTRDGDVITLSNTLDAGHHVRPAGADFTAGQAMTAPRLLGPSDIALLAAMNVPEVPVTRRPVVAIIATGDELVQPGEAPGPDQIIASNSYGLAALLQQHGAETRLLPIARESTRSARRVEVGCRVMSHSRKRRYWLTSRWSSSRGPTAHLSHQYGACSACALWPAVSSRPADRSFARSSVLE